MPQLVATQAILSQGCAGAVPIALYSLKVTPGFHPVLTLLMLGIFWIIFPFRFYLKQVTLRSASCLAQRVVFSLLAGEETAGSL